VCTITYDSLANRTTFSNDGFSVTHAHSGPITDIQYNTFNQSVVATCGFDSQIQLWSVGGGENSGGPLPSVASSGTLQLNENRCDCVQWNPNVDNVLLSTSLSSVYLWDVENSKASVSSS
jgi:WD40 repeat protein